MIKRLCIVGVGLIGGSFAKGLKATGQVETIVGYGLREAALQKAQALGVIDTYGLTLAEALKGADLVVIATPVDSFEQVLTDIKPHLEDHTILSDVGSTKGSVMRMVDRVFGEAFSRFVPAHPIAGKEKSGVEAADAQLFNNKRIILTPNTHTDPQAIELVSNLWQAIGAQVELMSEQAHDDLLGMTSHLPHMLAFALMDYLIEKNPHACDYAAGGFKDFSRIASSDAVMWRDICLNNDQEIIKHIEGYKAALDKLSSLIKTHDDQALETLFKDAKSARDSWLDN